MCGSKQLLGAYGSVARGLFAWNSLRRAGSRALRASCELQEVVHSVLTGNADVAKPQRIGGGPNVSLMGPRMRRLYQAAARHR